MATPLIPQEIYLLERFCSLERFGRMRDAWADMVKHAEECLQKFMLTLPQDYRSRPLWNQPDRVWGERVLPNFRKTLQGLNAGYIRLGHGDLSALGWANGVTGDLRGQRMDYPEDWMDEVEPGAADKFSALCGVARRLASPIAHTSNRVWTEGDLTTHYSQVFTQEPLNPPATWPVYRLNPKVHLKTGERIQRTGIYLPDIEHGFPALMVKEEGKFGIAKRATVRKSIDPAGYVDTAWTFVERVADSGGGVPGASDPITAGVRLRCDANCTCPLEGWWTTPAKLDSRRYFKQGEVMPTFTSDYGTTIWQWDDKQT